LFVNTFWKTNLAFLVDSHYWSLTRALQVFLIVRLVRPIVRSYEASRIQVYSDQGATSVTDYFTLQSTESSLCHPYRRNINIIQLTTHTYHHRYRYHSPICIKPGLGLGTPLGILVQSVRHHAPGSSDPSGIEPVTFYYISPSKKPL
jgi:hypothetical protein